MYGETGLRIVRSNQRYTTCHCPLPGHSDKHASSVIYHDSNTFVCFRCHIRLPLSQLLRELGLGEFDFETPEAEFNPTLFSENVRIQPLTDEAIFYLESRGFTSLEMLPSWVSSPLKNNGLAFLFQNFGKLFGTQVRLFPHFVTTPSVRYVFEGKRLAWFGDLQHAKQYKTKIVVFEKAFGALRAQVVANKHEFPVTALCSAGSNIQPEILDLVGPVTPFVFDRDEAGFRAAKFVKSKGFQVFIPTHPFDEMSEEGVKKILDKLLRET